MRRIIALLVCAVALIAPALAETMPVAALAQHTHLHGLAVDRQDASRLLIATHHGLFRAGPDGKAERISVVQDFMGFSPHPRDADILYASGHPPQGGNLGFIASNDGGRNWRQVSPGLNGPVDFHQMTVSPTDPARIYGVHGGLQISRDGGKSWALVGPAPPRIIGLAASGKHADQLYAATEAGLLHSPDAGKTWQVLLPGVVVTLVAVTGDGGRYIFAIGRGLLHAPEDQADFSNLSNDFAGEFLLHLAIDPTNPRRLFAATGKGRVLISEDQGRRWGAFGGGKVGWMPLQHPSDTVWITSLSAAAVVLELPDIDLVRLFADLPSVNARSVTYGAIHNP